jgi:two-component system, cell cycle sensor histidine kinase and response regulator CckA
MSIAGRVLVIDDEAGMREMIAELLETKGYVVACATRGTEGLERVRTIGFDAAIVDIRLPDISGVELLASLRAAAPDLEVIFITGYASLPTALKAIDGDAFAYLVKPFELEHLAATLKKALDRQHLARALRESEERYRLITEAINDGIFLMDTQGRLVFANHRATAITGYPADELFGRPIFGLLMPEGARRALERLASTAGDHDPGAVFETQLLTKDGGLVWVEANMTTVRREGQVVGRLGVLRDISERKRAEQQMRLQTVALEAAASGVVITDRAGRIIWTNPAFTTLTGYPLNEVVGQTLRLQKSGEHEPVFYEHLWETILSGQTWRGETINRRKDGTLYPEEQTITPMRDERGEITHFIAIKEDVSEQKKMREHLTHSEKLAAMGQLLASVAHELNNPLSVLTGHAAILKSTTDPKIADRALKMATAAERCGRIVRNFLALARRRPPERTRVGLNQVVRDALELLAYPLRVDNVEMRLELAGGLPALTADAHQLHQVVINLLSNAHYAVRETPRPRFIRVATQGSADRVTLEVADSGAGIRADVLERLFEPFFTTKPLGEGTGLGLAICKGIVETHGGSLSAESPPGQGAVFRMELPVEVGEPETIAEPTPESPVSGKAVLVVDDEPELATLLAEILGEDGHRVDTAENGAAALEKLREGAYDLIISDLRMPQLDGPGLYREVARRHPRLLRRMVFVTGDTLGPESTEFLRMSEALTFSKPFVASDVRRAVRQATRDR